MATETRYRKEGAKLIITASTNMGLYPYTLAQNMLFYYIIIVKDTLTEL